MLSQSENFAQVIAFAYGIAFLRWPNLKLSHFANICCFLQGSFGMVFCMFLAFLTVDPD